MALLNDTERKAVLSSIIELCRIHLFDPRGRQVYSYFSDQRKLTNQTIEQFQLGAFPANLFNQIPYEICADLGITSVFTKTHRIIIPIYDPYGEPLAIMGRRLIDDPSTADLPKYYNSHYEKAEHLFGLNLAKTAMTQKGYALVVEGNFDVITAHQHGLTETVAASSASFSKKQYTLVNRYADRVFVMFDSDEAGRNGMLRAQQAFPDVRLEKLPAGYKDLDEYFTARPKEGTIA